VKPASEGNVFRHSNGAAASGWIIALPTAAAAPMTICRRASIARFRHIPLTMFSVIFLASPSSIMVLSR
jgi:hypothetical protein